MSKHHDRSNESSTSESENEYVEQAPVASSTDEESDEEFDIPKGFQSIKGTSAISCESIQSNDTELWFFKLPKNVDASVLHDISFKVSSQPMETGTVVQSISHDDKKYELYVEDSVITQQLVNAFPSTSNRKAFGLGKPFTKCFSLVEARTTVEEQLERSLHKRKNKHLDEVDCKNIEVKTEHKVKKKKNKH